MQISEPAEYVILGLLKERPMHGYELFQHIEGSMLGEIIHLEMSQMYAFLKKLERLGYIVPDIEIQNMRPPRKIFHLTDEGQAAFQVWLMQPVEKPRDIRILFLIKLYFMQRLQPQRMQGLVEEQIHACQRFLHHLEERAQRGTAYEDETFLEHVVLSSRIHQTRSLLTWMDELQRDLSTL